MYFPIVDMPAVSKLAEKSAPVMGYKTKSFTTLKPVNVLSF